jgi:hypothetical protein
MRKLIITVFALMTIFGATTAYADTPINAPKVACANDGDPGCPPMRISAPTLYLTLEDCSPHANTSQKCENIPTSDNGSKWVVQNNPIPKNLIPELSKAKPHVSRDPSKQEPENSPIHFDLAFAEKIKGFHTLEEVQKLAGSVGAIENLGKTTKYHWWGDNGFGNPGGGHQYENGMEAVVNPRKQPLGTIEVYVTDGSQLIQINNRGDFKTYSSSEKQ